VPVALSLLPVLVFLAGIELIDFYRLVRPLQVLAAIGIGCVAAVVCYALNGALAGAMSNSRDAWLRWGAPSGEEVTKALCVYLLLRSNRIGFLVDAGIAGFAIGSGFALIENLTDLADLSAAGVLTVATRGFGTAIMHGGATAMFAAIFVPRAAIAGTARASAFFPRLAPPVAIHVLYNQSFWPPVWQAAAAIVVLPVVLSEVLWRCEKTLEEWLGAKDADLLQMISTGASSSSRPARYLRLLESTFGPRMAGDMLCYVQVSVELSAQAGHDAEFPGGPSAETADLLVELAWLQTQIGRAGRLVLAPLLSGAARG
jgi:RsiW-degrading membrane proteinase PrsW (M82 family)